jgi:NADH-quinone oxidoreductase subunit F
MKNPGKTVLICHGSACEASASPLIADAFRKVIKKLKINNVEVKITGCHGFCQSGPIVIVEPDGIFYSRVKVEDASEIVRSHLKNNQLVERLFYKNSITNKPIPHYKDIDFYKKQQRIIILRNCGHIDPENIDDYLAVEGYKALKKVLTNMSQVEVIEEIKKSGLRGRGGAGFPTGKKWEFCYKTAGNGNKKYIICNADEGDPGAFMDRSLLEADPHSVLEGLIIAGYAIGADEGYIYVRAEYPLAVSRIYTALDQARQKGFLGENILGTGFNFKINVMEGAGAFVCGEETALITSIEGNRGNPRSKPPYPAQSGLWGYPTTINNVKTLASVSPIILNGADWYLKIGTKNNSGTAVFALTGHISNCGLVEVTMGTTLREIIYDIGGGIPGGKSFKAVQTGGPSGGCIPSKYLDTPVDFESLSALGSIMGSGGMVVMNEDTCMVDIARYFMEFTYMESCGKCAPCRLGTRQMLCILDDIASGRGKETDIELLQEIGNAVKCGSLCGLGQTAPNPVLTTIRYFRKEYEEHIRKHRCSAVVCKDLVIAPCRHTCPAGIDVPRYVRYIRDGRFEDALAVIMEKIPFPAVCGYVCFHPCETKCKRGELDEPIAIRALKKFVSNSTIKVKPALNKTGRKVAVVGAGPAGLTCAYYLSRLGHNVTVFEMFSKPGGMLRTGIPKYRLPEKILSKEIKAITGSGVKIKTRTKINSVRELRKKGYSAVFIATGAYKGLKMGIPGENLPGVVDCISFLNDVNSGKKVKLGRRVGIIGGGNAAIDSARVAKRLGAKEVIVLYRRTRKEMPASREEIEDMIEEKIKIQFLTLPGKIQRKKGSLEVELIKMRLGKIGADGRARPEPIEGSEYSMDLDNLILAIGQVPDVPKNLCKTDRRGRIVVDQDTLQTEEKGVFAGGDAVTGPASVIEAIAYGRQGAISIDKYLGGKGNIDEVIASVEINPEIKVKEGKQLRVKIPVLSANKRVNNFKLVESGYSAGMAIKEASRCLSCDLEDM